MGKNPTGRRRWLLAVGWVVAGAAAFLLGAWLIDRQSAEERRLGEEIEALRRENAELRASAEPPARPARKSAPGITVEGLETAFRAAAAKKVPAVEFPELPDLPLVFNSTARRAVTIEVEVSHSWQVGSLEEVMRRLPDYLSWAGVARPREHFKQSGSQCGLDVSLEQRDLVRLVRLLGATGYRLRSWSPPYPDHEQFTGPPDRLVRYRAVFE